MLSSKDIRELNEGEINSRIAELEEERFRLKFRAGTETLEDPLRLRIIRKDVARLKTVLKEKVIGIEFAKSDEAAPKKQAGGAKTRRVRKTKSNKTR
ncbi:MAG TPA: 50S ribosomal protein L29 [Gemmatimonadaceae bacterium]